MMNCDDITVLFIEEMDHYLAIKQSFKGLYIKKQRTQA